MLRPDSSAGDPYEGRYAGLAVGGQLNAYRAIDLSSGYHLSFLADPRHPGEGTQDGDLAYSAGALRSSSRRLVTLDAGVRATYQACRDGTRYAPAVPVALRPGRSQALCVQTDQGVVALVTVRARHTGASDYVTLDLTLWKGPRPSP
jgi:hypothetical protein